MASVIRKDTLFCNYKLKLQTYENPRGHGRLWSPKIFVVKIVCLYLLKKNIIHSRTNVAELNTDIHF